MSKLKEILIPVAVVAAGVLGAFATQMSESSNTAQALEPAWIDNVAPCAEDPYMCASLGSEVCTIIIDGVERQLRGKYNSSDATCPKVLFKPGS